MSSKFGFRRGGTIIWFLITSLFLLVIYSPTLVEVIPFFQIKKFEINTSDPNLRKLVEQALEKYQKNWVYLNFNFNEFVEILQKSSGFYIENAYIQSFNPFEGVLKLDLTLNKPNFKFNDRYFLSSNGRIFFYPGLKSGYVLDDRTKLWQIGEIYDPKKVEKLKDLFEELNLTTATVGNFKITLQGRNVEVVLPPHRLEPNEIETLTGRIEKIFPAKGFSVHLFGMKGASVKIYKE